MRVIVAYDGSAGASEAVALAEGIPWPAGSFIRVVSVIEPTTVQLPPWPMGESVTERVGEATAELLASDQGRVIARLSAPGRTVDAVLLRDRPASGVLDHAQEFAADLLITGSRGHGPIASLLLGSVSAEVVDHASCPVIIARRSTMRRIVLATDGSSAAAAAEDILLRWPVFADVPIRVVSVADVVRPWTTGVAPTMYSQVLDAYARDLAGARSSHEQIARETAARLSKAGLHADPQMRSGDAAGEIIDAASEWDADLIVVGSRGYTGVERLLLGSVARNVITGSDASVLVVHVEPDEARQSS